jgi:hypothetical protein
MRWATPQPPTFSCVIFVDDHATTKITRQACALFPPPRKYSNRKSREVISIRLNVRATHSGGVELFAAQIACSHVVSIARSREPSTTC